ncbi:hypothetical protein P7C70_g2501, partial [Phenoliferia sp. Uapishka_3]
MTSKPWSALFYYPSSWQPYPSPLQFLAQERPTAVVLFSLSPLDQGLIVNVFVGSESAKRALRNKLWGGAVLRFKHSNGVAPFTQTPVPGADIKISITSVTPGRRVSVKVVQLDVSETSGGDEASGDQSFDFEIVRESKEPLVAYFRDFVEKRVWELEMGEVDIVDAADDSNSSQSQIHECAAKSYQASEEKPSLQRLQTDRGGCGIYYTQSEVGRSGDDEIEGRMEKK